MTSKTITVRVLSRDGEWLGILQYSAISGFMKSLDGGLGELTIKVDGEFDTQSPLIIEGNWVEVMVKDPEITDGPEWKVYSGYVSQVNRKMSAKGESVTLVCLGHHTSLQFELYRDGTTTTIVNGGVDVGVQFLDVIAKFKTLSGAPISATSGYSVEITGGPSINYTFERRTCREAIDDITDQASGNQHWYVDANGRAWFKAPSTGDPDHTLTFGRHFTTVNAVKSLEKVRNRVLIWNGVTGVGQVYRLYEDTESEERYGPRLARVTDYGIEDVGGAAGVAARFLANTATPPITVMLKLNDSNAEKGYDLESIEPGDTVALLGLGDTDWAKYRMVVTSVRYNYDEVSLKLDIIQSGMAKFQKTATREIDKLEGTGTPTDFDTP